MSKPSSDIMKRLVQVSREYGSDPSFVLSGGGNSSYKEGQTMLVKGSGTRMASITEDDFVAMDRSLLDTIWQKGYPQESENREEAVLSDLMAARLAGEENKRPSVETLLHSLFPESWVMHTHPALVNGITCSRDGEKAVRSLFGPEAIWVPVIEPGYTLAKEVKQRLPNSTDSSRKETLKETPLVFLQNHGVFITGNSENQIKTRYTQLFSTIKNALTHSFDESTVTPWGEKPSTWEETPSTEERAALVNAYTTLSDSQPVVLPFSHPLLDQFLSDREHFTPLQEPFTPDHIVYAGFRPHFTTDLSHIQRELEEYRQQWGELPKIVASSEGTCWAIASGNQAAVDARDLFYDAALIALYSTSFGGPSPMPEWLISFIRTWEAEKYRQKKG
jgi:rhamnose utilization protein RhaD (predicted bifunctional aldolase and dehydrogenase)